MSINIGYKAWHPYHKIGTVLGVTGLGLSIAAHIQNRRISAMETQRIEIETYRKNIEARSLSALNRIHKSLEGKSFS